MKDKTTKRKAKNREAEVAESERPAGGHNTTPGPGKPKGKQRTSNQDKLPSSSPSPGQDTNLKALQGTLEDAFGKGAQTRDEASPASDQPAGQNTSPNRNNRWKQGAEPAEPDSVGGNPYGDFRQEGNSIDGPAQRPQPMSTDLEKPSPKPTLN